MGKLKTRKPTGLAPWPVVLVEGLGKTGKSYTCTLLSADKRIGDMYWLDLGEGAADQYAAIDGVAYDILEHDGRYRTILDQVLALVEEVPGVQDDGRPNVLVIDSVSNLWRLLKGEADASARRMKSNVAKLERDPDAEVVISMDRWNVAAAKWRAVLDPLMQWPGLVLLTARGSEVAKVDANGKPVAGEKDYSVESHKSLTNDVDVWVRATEPGRAVLVGGRSSKNLIPYTGKPVPGYTSNGLSALLFDLLGLGVGKAGVRDLKRDVIDAAPQHMVQLAQLKHAVLGAFGGDKSAAAEWFAKQRVNDELVPVEQADSLVAMAKVAARGDQPAQVDTAPAATGERLPSDDDQDGRAA